jgi:hypothetical protein
MMELVQRFLAGFTVEPFRELVELLSLPPDRLGPALALLAAVVVLAEFTRIALGTELTRSVIAHVTICLLTFVAQAVLLAGVLLWAASRHPGRASINLGLVAGLYVVWYLAGQLTTLVRADSEGADVGFMSVGALLTFTAGLLALVIF